MCLVRMIVRVIEEFVGWTLATYTGNLPHRHSARLPRGEFPLRKSERASNPWFDRPSRSTNWSCDDKSDGCLGDHVSADTFEGLIEPISLWHVMSLPDRGSG